MAKEATYLENPLTDGVSELDQICPDCGAPIRDHMIGGPAPYHPRPIEETDLERRISRLRSAVNFEEFDWEINGGSPFDDAKALLTEYDRLRAEIDNLRGEPVAWRWRYEGEGSWTFTSKDPTKRITGPDVICEPLYATPPQAARPDTDGAKS